MRIAPETIIETSNQIKPIQGISYLCKGKGFIRREHALAGSRHIDIVFDSAHV